MKNNNCVKTFFLFFTSCLFVQTLQAQLPGVEDARTKYPDVSAVYLNKSQQYRVFMDKGVLSGVCDVHEQIYINKESGLVFQSRSVGTNKFVEASNIKAFTMVPKNKKYEKQVVDKIDLKADPGKYSFYDDQKSYEIVFPAVQPGAVLDLSYQLKYLEPRFMGSYYWMDYVPDMESELVVSVEKNIHIAYKLFNCDEQNIVFTTEEKKNETVYHWKMKDGKAGTYYGDAPNFRYFEPHMIFYVTDYPGADGKQKQLLGTPKELYTWYSDLQKNVNKTEDSGLKKVTDSLVAGVTSEDEKIKKIFYWVQDNISYVAFEDGLGGFIPRDAGLVCTRKFGDCKDMASIIHEMLRIAGIPSYLTWIGSRDIPYTYDDVPTPSVDNHMITTYKDKNGKWNFLDGTGKHAPEELYTSFIQGKQGLVSITPDSFLLVTVPVRDTSVSQTVDSIAIDINDNNVVTGKGKAKLTGYDQLEYSYSVENLGKEERQDYFKDYFAKGNNKVSFTDITENPADRTQPLLFTYNFNVSDYARRNQDEVYINLNMDGGLGLEQILDTRKVPVEFKHITKKVNITTLNVPVGYKPEYIPQSTSYGNDVAGYSSTYTLKGNKIVHTSSFYINTLILKVADFEKYNKVLSEQTKANKQTVSLKKS
ncbi:MAG: transglutaminase-like enzyme predicted cysteine protease [Bacteroidetes bacterium]|nr:transglutaminase-like enzyme predicted cysteine protease [Bacteroidota bacterium]